MVVVRRQPESWPHLTGKDEPRSASRRHPRCGAAHRAIGLIRRCRIPSIGRGPRSTASRRRGRCFFGRRRFCGSDMKDYHLRDAFHGLLPERDGDMFLC